MSRAFLERMSVVRSVGEATLEALFHPAVENETRTVLLVPGLPGLGGGMDHAILAELSFAFSQMGLSVLRFNFRGVGVSSKISAAPLALWHDEITLSEAEILQKSAAQDVVFALEHLFLSVVPEEMIVVGIGFGASALAIWLHSMLEEGAGICGDIIDEKHLFRLIGKVGLVSAPLKAPFVFDKEDELVEKFPTLLCEIASEKKLELFSAEEDFNLSDEVILSAQKSQVYPQRIAGADVSFTRGLTALGQTVVARML